MNLEGYDETYAQIESRIAELANEIAELRMIAESAITELDGVTLDEEYSLETRRAAKAGTYDFAGLLKKLATIGQ